MRAFTDNYIWLIDSPAAPGRLVAVDPGDAAPVIAELDRRGASLAAILLTHHHPDHIGGVSQLLRREWVPVYGPEDDRIAEPIHGLSEGDRCELRDLGLSFEILHVPGHTLSHIAFVGHGALFSGDTLFSAGCGRMFEGTPEQMSNSLDRLRSLPGDTQVYCGHEYTAANLRFALEVDPANRDAAVYADEVRHLRGRDQPTLPSTVGLESRVNPFFRCDSTAVAAAAARHAGRELSGPVEVFAELRSWKDGFR